MCCDDLQKSNDHLCAEAHKCSEQQNAMSENILAMIQTDNGLGYGQAYLSLSCHTLLLDRIREKQLWLPPYSEYAFRIIQDEMR